MHKILLLNVFVLFFSAALADNSMGSNMAPSDNAADFNSDDKQLESTDRRSQLGLATDRLLVGLGIFEFHHSKHRAVAGNIEYHFMQNWLGGLNPFVGAMVTHKGSTHTYAGISLPIKLTKKVHFIPSFAPGFYLKGGGKKLGHVIEFRSQLEIAYMRDDKIRIGLAINHVSSASLGSKNPGEESLMLNISFPVNRPKSDRQQ